MKVTVSYLLMLQKWINSKQKLWTKNYALCLGNISTYFTINNTKKKTGLKGVVNFFSLDFNAISTNNISDIHEYLMKRT